MEDDLISPVLPSIGCPISLFPLDKNILGRKRETHSTEHDISVTFWQVVIDIFLLS
jgi:hypothetical protein